MKTASFLGIGIQFHKMKKLTFALMCLFALLLSSNDANALEPGRPNILMILCDDLGYADVGFNGSPDIPTPSLDNLAKAGTVFSSAYVPHPFCGPSRAGLMTGRYPHCLGSQFNLPESGEDIGANEGVPTSETFISKVLQDAGYRTGLVGKWHLGKTPEYHPNKRGFEDFYGFLGGGHEYFPEQYRAKYKRQTRNGKGNFWSYVGPLEHNGAEVTEDEYLTDALSSEGARFVRDASETEKPFFLFMSYNAPHTPLQAKKEDYEALRAIPDTKRRTYAAMVAAVDRGVGTIVQELKATGQFENTLIVFFSDNGGRLDQGGNNAPLRGSKGDISEGGFRVPMFFHWPDHVDPGETCSHPISALDFYPTFARLADAKIPTGKQLDGRDIWDDLIASKPFRPNMPIFALRHRNGDNEIGVRHNQWKVRRTERSGWQLFDVETDISETSDVGAEHPEILKSMIVQAERWTHSHKRPLWFDSQKVSDGWSEFRMPNFKKTFGNAWTASTTAAATRLVKATKKFSSDATPQGEVLYQEDFETAPVYVIAKGPNDNNISSISFGAGSAATDVPSVKFGQFGGTGQYLSDTKTKGSITGGKFAIGSHIPVMDKSRNRSYVTFVDTSSAKIGQYNISFDVSDFRSEGSNTGLYLHIYEGAKADKGYLDFQVTHQAMLPQLAPSAPTMKGHGGMIDGVLLDNEITADGRFSLNFGISEAGKPGNFIALAWSQVKREGVARMPSMTIDNLQVKRLPSAERPEHNTDVSPTGQSGNWKLLEDFSDEFNGTEVDTSKWNSNPKSYGAMTWDEGNSALKDGNLHLKLDYQPHVRSNQKLFYRSGILRSHQQMTYGYYEARIKGCSLFPGACPAFWAFSNGRKYDGEVRYCEIDFVELQMNELNHETKERNSVHHIDMNLHLRLADENGKLNWVRPPSHPELCKTEWIAPWDPRDDFHIYGCDVTPEKITWYIDGDEVGSKPNKYWHLPMNLALTLELRHPHIGWEGQTIFPVPESATQEGFPTTMLVDYVRVWQRQ